MNRKPFLILMGAVLWLAMVSNGQAAQIHVAKGGDDKNPGTAEKPLATIQRAAELAQPGDNVTVHAGVYRERVSPPRGGESDERRITYEAAAGEKVEIKGSEVVKNWTKEQGEVWKTTLPNKFFGDFNPFADLIHGDWFSPKGREHHTGAVYLNGEWLTEAAKFEDLFKPAGSVTTRAPSGVLLNVAWLRPEKVQGRVAASGYAAINDARKAPCEEGGECIGWIRDGSWIKYEKVDFGAGSESVELRAASASTGGRIELRRGAPGGELLGSCTVPNTGGWQSWVSFKAKIKPLSGSQTLCLVIRGGAPDNAEPVGALWFAKVDAENTTIWAQFKGVDPNTQLIEVNARRTVFYPDKPGRNYITVRGFTLRHAATPWAPPTAEQIGLIGTHWSKGWIIENNVISHSVCSGIALGKHGDQFDNTSANSAEGYVKTIERAHAFSIPWTKENIGHHIVRNNTISHCEQTGIVGSLGCAFSTVTGNVIHDIHVRRLFSGAEMAGIKFHGAIDAEISNNHIYRTCRGIWLDWMAQGTHVSRNLLHDNTASEDLFVEVDHGPFLVDNNIFLSPRALLVNSQGGAYAHNLMTGAVRVIHTEKRETPYHPAHSTAVAGLAGNPSGDDKYFNNLMARQMSLTPYDAAKLPVFMGGNVFAAGAQPSKHEAGALVAAEFDPEIQLIEKDGGMQLELTLDKAWGAAHACKLVTTEMLGKAAIPKLPYEKADGSPVRIDTDYFGKPRDAANPTAGPFEAPRGGRLSLRVW